MKTIRNIQDFPDKFSDICSGQMPKECDTDDYFDKGTICAEADDVSGKEKFSGIRPLEIHLRPAEHPSEIFGEHHHDPL